MSAKQENLSNNATAAAAAATMAARCSTCDGPVPWQETNPHAHEANGKICTECGHFYCISTVTGPFVRNTLLAHYCSARDWDKALVRVRYVPQEAVHIDPLTGMSAFHWAFRYRAPIPLIRALLEANPDAFTRQGSRYGYVGVSPYTEAFFSCETTWRLELFNIALAVNPKLILVFPDEEECFESALEVLEMRLNYLLRNADLSPSTPIDKILAYTTGTGDLGEGQICNTFNLMSMFVKTDYYGTPARDLESPILHAVAGCRDPYISGKRFLLLVLRSFPGQLQQGDERGRFPLHIAASTINRDYKEYNDYLWREEAEKEHREHAWEAFMFGCKHGCPFLYRNAEEFLSDCECNCDCDKDGEDYCNSQCDCKVPKRDHEDDCCEVCFSKYIDREEKKCQCHQKYEKAKTECKCQEAFEFYHAKMHNPHRLDKKDVIKAMAEACPEAASKRDKHGMLPIHLAVTHGKCWDGGVQAIVSAFPDGTGVKDPQSQLYPFMTSASGNDLDTTFELLRFRPDVLAWYGLKQSKEMQVTPSRGRKRKFEN